jgi:predicted alpha/beta-hydrolase family hydrolase
MLRVEHGQTIKTPALIVQGERYGFGDRQQVAGYKLSKQVRVLWLSDDDHSSARKSSGRIEEKNWKKGGARSRFFCA